MDLAVAHRATAAPTPGSSGNLIDATVVETCEQILPEHANSAGWLLAGQLMAWVDICGGISAKRHAGHPCATVAMEQFCFFEPIAVGEIATIKTQVNRAFTTSMEIGAAVYAEHPGHLDGSGERKRQCCSAILVFALIDKNNGPLSAVVPQGQTQETRYLQAESRRRQRNSSVPPAPSAASRLGLPFSIFREKLREREAGEAEREGEGEAERHDKHMQQDHRHMSDTRVEMMELILPTHSNTIGIAFGGQLMRWMDIVAGMSVSRLSTRRLAFVSAIDSLVLFTPVKIGEVVKLSAEVVCTFDSSLEVAVAVEKENPYTCETVQCGSGYFTFTLRMGKKALLPRIIATSAEEKQAQNDARHRQHQRLTSGNRTFSVPPKHISATNHTYKKKQQAQQQQVQQKNGYSHARQGLEHNYRILTLCFIMPPLAVFLLLTSPRRQRTAQAGPRSTSILDAANILVCCLLTLLMWIPGMCYALMNYTFISLVEELKHHYQ